MIKVLIVDDNDYDKTQVIIKLLKEFKEISENDIIEVKDTSSAKRILKEEKIDLLILDIKIPINNGDDADPEGGTMAAVSSSDCVMQATASRAKELENFLEQP